MSGSLRGTNADTPTHVLLPILIQDPGVLSRRSQRGSIHPVVASAESGFLEGPACARVAVVDLDATTGALRPPAKFDPAGSKFRSTAAYAVTIPGGSRWTSDRSRGEVADLRALDYDDAFLKVSVFGTVIRTIDFVERLEVLGRRVAWAFAGDQLLIVPRAGLLENAFYHRESRSLQFFSFHPAARPNRIVHTALSQDIVTHETAHALIDGIAPDLYTSTNPESLAIHESVADLTAVMLSLRSRESWMSNQALARAVDVVSRSSRFSQIAEEFGQSLGARSALRDAVNRKTFGPPSGRLGQEVDEAAPHSIGQVLTGAVYGVFRKSFRSLAASNSSSARNSMEVFRFSVNETVERIGGMLYKGLDWLPPGEVSLAGYISAVLAADRFHHPSLQAERSWLIQECVRRRIGEERDLDAAVDEAIAAPADLAALQQKPALVRRFVRANGHLFGLPSDASIGVNCRMISSADRPPNTRWSASEAARLDREYKYPADAARALLLKVEWWSSAPIDLGIGAERRCEVKLGATIVLDEEGAIAAVLAGAGSPSMAVRRHLFLKRLAANGTLLTAGERTGPDGEPLRGFVNAAVAGDTLRVSGGFSSLHLAEPPG